MEFASPGFLWLLFAVPLILLFGLWRTRPVPVTVPSVGLWEKLKERNPPIRELRKPALQLSLVLQALAAALLLAALAGPFTASPMPMPRSIYILLDDSASMGAVEPGNAARRRWDLARDAVRSILAQAAPDDRVVVVAANAGARHDGAPSGVGAFLAGLAPTGGGDAGVARAARRLAAEAGSGPGRAMIVVSDHRDVGPTPGAPKLPGGEGGSGRDPRGAGPEAPTPSAALEAPPTAADRGRETAPALITVGAPVRNAGIAALEVESPPAGGARIFVRCAGPANETVELELDSSDDGERWTPTPGVPRSLRVPLDGAGQGGATAALAAEPPGRLLRAHRPGGPDALSIDDVAWLVRAPDRAPAVVFAVRPGQLVRALQSVAGLPVQVRLVDAVRPAPAEDRSPLVVYDGVAPERLPEGRFVALINPPGPIGPFAAGAPLDIVPDERREAPPWTDHVDLQAVAPWRGRACAITGATDDRGRETAPAPVVIVGGRARDDASRRVPLLALWDRPGGAVLYAGFDLTWRGDRAASDAAWANDPGFAIFWQNVVDAVYSGPGRSAGGWRSSRAGDGPWAPGLGSSRNPDGSRSFTAVNLADDAESACPSGGGTAPGAYRLSPAPEGRRIRSRAETCVVAAVALLSAAWWLSRRGR